MVSIAGESAMRCVNVSVDGDHTYFKNICSQTISVAFCSTDGNDQKYRCGRQGSDWNPYYTSMKTLNGGEKEYRYKYGSVEYAACFGAISAWDAKDKFSSDRNGRFSCHN